MVGRCPYVCIRRTAILELIDSMPNLLLGLRKECINPILEAFPQPAVLLHTLLLGFFVPPILMMMDDELQLWHV